jgi:predicted transcriptional regulator
VSVADAMIFVAYVLATRGPMPAYDLEEIVGCSRRSIDRAVEGLRLLGVVACSRRREAGRPRKRGRAPHIYRIRP